MYKFFMLKLFVVVILICLLIPSLKIEAKTQLIKDPNLETVIKEKLGINEELNEENLEDLQYLLIYENKKIKALNGLEIAQNMNQFLIQYNAISDLSPLSTLKNLWFLSLNHNNITDISPISQLKKVNSLGLGYNNIIDISSLEGLSLGSLYLESNPFLEDISVLNHMDNIHKLNLANTSIRDLTSLINQPIESLNISDTDVEDLSPLEKIPSLKTLYLSYKPLNESSKNVIKRLSENGVVIIYPTIIKSSTNIAINGVLQKYDVQPILVYDRALAPMRKIFEVLGAKVTWDEKTKSITATSGSIVIKLTIGSRKVTVNDIEMKLEVVPQIYQNTTMVPLRFISEALGVQLEWDNKTSTVNIIKK